VVGALSAAALAVGRTAWHAGQDIEFAVTAAGYSAALARGVYEYFASHATPELEEATQAASQSQGEMPYQVKRARTGAKSKVPVAKNVKKFVKRCMDRVIETKYVDGTVGFTNPGANGVVAANFLCGIMLGTADNTRVGNNIRVRRIHFKGWWGGGTEGVLRLGFYWDRQPNGAAPAAADILQADGVNAAYNHDTVVGSGGARFSVVKDTRSLLHIAYGTGTTLVPVTMTWTGDKIVQFTGNSGTVADMVTNNFIVMANGDGGADLTGELSVEYQDA